MHQICPKLCKRQNGLRLAYNAVRSGREPQLCVIIVIFSSALCYYYYYVLLRSHLLCKCNRHNLMTIVTLCIDVRVPVLWDCVFMLGFRLHQPDFMMLKNSFVFMCIGTPLFYIILFWGVDSFEVFHSVWMQVNFPLWEKKCDRL